MKTFLAIWENSIYSAKTALATFWTTSRKYGLLAAPTSCHTVQAFASSESLCCWFFFSERANLVNADVEKFMSKLFSKTFFSTQKRGKTVVGPFLLPLSVFTFNLPMAIRLPVTFAKVYNWFCTGQTLPKQRTEYSWRYYWKQFHVS